METLPFFGVSVEYFCAFSVYFVNLRSFHFGVTMEFSTMCEERKEVQFSNMKPVRRKDTNRWQLTWLS